MVSICCSTYNHEKYLRKALNGVLMQEVNFKYEILIGEDCSTDKSRDIIEKYVKKFPDIIKPFYRDKNRGALDNNIELYDNAKGKYITLLETDDFWINKKKLQKQVDFLENNPEYVAVTCGLYPVDKNGVILKNVIYPECKKRIYSHKDYRKWILPGQTSMMLYRNMKEIREHIKDEYMYKAHKYGPGDRMLLLTLFSLGKIYCLKEKMGAYRYIIDEGSSFSATNELKYYDYMKAFYNLRRYVYKYDMDEEIKKSAEFMLFEAATASYLLQKSIDLKTYLKIIKINRYKVSSVYCFVRHSIQKTSEKVIDLLTGSIHI